jgi:putative transposase
VTELGRVRDAMRFRLIGYVLMPEHVHLLISKPREGTPSTVLHRLKLGVARKLRKWRRDCTRQLRLQFAPSRDPLRAFWQARFYDFNVYSTEGRGKS